MRANARIIDTRAGLCYDFRVRISGCLFGGVLTTALGIVWKILKVAIELVAKAIYYFGLYVPLAYLLYGLILYLIFDFNPFYPDIDGKLYIFGFALCLICAVIITVKNVFVRPLRNYFENSRVIEYNTKGKSKNLPEAPRIYKSRVNPGVIVYEYENRYDLYKQSDGRLVLVKTEWKKGKGRR